MRPGENPRLGSNKKLSGMPYGITKTTPIKLYLTCLEEKRVSEVKQVDGGVGVGGTVAIPLSTLTALYAINFSDCHRETFSVLLCSSSSSSAAVAAAAAAASGQDDLHFRLKLRDLPFETGVTFKTPRQVDCCHLPAIFVPEKNLCITGLCAVLRFLINYGRVEDDDDDKDGADDRDSSPLLGYQGGCLSAPAEVSTWTKFCEVDLPEATKAIWNELAQRRRLSAPAEPFLLPVELAKFETHLQQPIRIHNIRKRMLEEQMRKKEATSLEKGRENESNSAISLENGREVVLDSNTGEKVDPITIYAQSQHVYAEGPDLLLSDVIIYANYQVILLLLKGDKGDSVEEEEQQHVFCHSEPSFLATLLPHTARWLDRMRGQGAAAKMKMMPATMGGDGDANGLLLASLHLPETPFQSLYRSDPKRVNPAARTFTRQHHIDRVHKWFYEENSGKELLLKNRFDSDDGDENDDVAANGLFLDWTSLPRLVHPLGGFLPQKRLEKKCQQLEGMAAAAVKLVRDELQQKKDSFGSSDPVVVVDFCSGGGHLGILMAYLLPQAVIYLVENKEESMRRAMERVELLGLSNVRFFQCNLDYFVGSFDLGVSLHACGVATDLVLKACLDRQAAFVCCPCCYGSLGESHLFDYPKSQAFRNLEWVIKDYLVMGHTADQTHGTNDKHEQGARAMDLVDSDRGREAVEAGYEVTLDKLRPLSCTPKHNLLIGIKRS